MSVNTVKDLVKLYHPSGQQPKEMATAVQLTIGALYSLGLPTGEYDKVLKNLNYKLPSSIIVVGSDGGSYKYKGSGDLLDPVQDTFDSSGVGSSWVKLGECYAS